MLSIAFSFSLHPLYSSSPGFFILYDFSVLLFILFMYCFSDIVELSSCVIAHGRLWSLGEVITLIFLVPWSLHSWLRSSSSSQLFQSLLSLGAIDTISSPRFWGYLNLWVHLFHTSCSPLWQHFKLACLLWILQCTRVLSASLIFPKVVLKFVISLGLQIWASFLHVFTSYLSDFSPLPSGVCTARWPEWWGCDWVTWSAGGCPWASWRKPWVRHSQQVVGVSSKHLNAVSRIHIPSMPSKSPLSVALPAFSRLPLM